MVTTSIAPLSIAVVLALKGADASPPFLGGSCRINRYFSPDLWGADLRCGRAPYADQSRRGVFSNGQITMITAKRKAYVQRLLDKRAEQTFHCSSSLGSGPND
jgi:hypothetical protein